MSNYAGAHDDIQPDSYDDDSCGFFYPPGLRIAITPPRDREIRINPLDNQSKFMKTNWKLTSQGIRMSPNGLRQHHALFPLPSTSRYSNSLVVGNWVSAIIDRLPRRYFGSCEA